MDQDGYNHTFLSSGNTIVLTPRLAPNGRELSFFSYREKIVNGRRIPLSAAVYRYDLFERRSELLMRFDGMTYAPRYSPDGNLLIFSLSRRGSSSIYTLNLHTKHVTRLTKGSCIDTSPCYSPNGKHIVFNSDRGGTQQLYIMDSDGSNIRRLSFGRGRYATPVWSPRGDWIAFTKFGSEGFHIGVIRPDGSGERMLASGYLVEGPTWSPNGRVIMFSHLDYARNEKIFSVDITGHNKRRIWTPQNAIDPEWSGRINL
jgi:TolB protein